jgi:hypothetical protein
MKLGMVIGGAAGYYFGAKAGRERYSEINRKIKELRGKAGGGSPSAASEASSAASRATSMTGSVDPVTTHISGPAAASTPTSTTLGAAGTETSPASFGTLP